MYTPKLEQQRYGLNKTVDEIMELLRDTNYLHTIKLSQYKKEQLRVKIRKIIQHNVLGKGLLRAIALDLLHDGVIHTESYVYQYLKVYVYHSNTRALLGDLVDARDHTETET